MGKVSAEAMELQAWTEESPVDAARRRRLFVGYGIGTMAVALGLAVVAKTSHARIFEPDDSIDVSLVQAPPIEAPEPEIEVAEEAKPKQVKARRRGPAKLSGSPKAIPEGVPDEANPDDRAHEEGDMDDLFGDGGEAEQAKKRVSKALAAAKAAKPKLPEIQVVTERGRTTRPVAISQPPPAYPSEAKAQGVNATIVVRYLVGRDGTVLKVKVISGHPLLNDEVVRAVKAWRFEPGTYGGENIAVWQTARFPFRLRS